MDAGMFLEFGSMRAWGSLALVSALVVTTGVCE
jgi:hypothetical protein